MADVNTYVNIINFPILFYSIILHIFNSFML
jgi:hypothetical protein